MSNEICSSLFSNSSSSLSSLASGATSVADKLGQAEQTYIDAVKSGDQGKIADADVLYKKQQLAFESITQMIKNKFDTMLRAIRNMALN